MAQGTQVPVETGAPSSAGRPPGRQARPGSTTTAGMIVKIAVLAPSWPSPSSPPSP